jgi:DNA polymerase (family 10)
VTVAISTDAHSTGDFEFMKFGFLRARRGWLEAADVLNTRGPAGIKRGKRRK